MNTRGTPEGSCSFSTPLGRASISWTKRGISRLSLPDPRELSRGDDGDPPPAVAVRLVRDVQAYFQGEKASLKGSLDLSGTTPFERAVYSAARAIPRGKVSTYGEIARAIDRPRSARAVGAALGRNPIPLLIPCHRVVAASGPGGFSARGGLSLKKKMLALDSR